MRIGGGALAISTNLFGLSLEKDGPPSVNINVLERAGNSLGAVSERSRRGLGSWSWRGLVLDPLLT